MRLELSLLSYYDKIVLKKKGNKRFIYGTIRKKYLVWTPEELIRQLLLHYLMIEKNYPSHRIRVELGLRVNDLQKRCDILVFDQQLQPILLIECKAKDVPINQGVLEQVARYNLTFKVPFLVVTNGPVSYCAAVDLEQQTSVFLEAIPDYQTLIDYQSN